MKSILLEPIKGKNHRLAITAIGGAITLVLEPLGIFAWYFDLLPLAIGAVISSILIYFAWRDVTWETLK